MMHEFWIFFYPSTIPASAWRDWKKPLKNLNQVRQCPSWGSNWTSPEYMSGVLLLHKSSRQIPSFVFIYQ
jgi:hypothetical protein